MSTQRKPKARQAKNSRPAASIVWFEIPADNIERARKFYGGLFGWKIVQLPGVPDYWHIDTGGGDDTPDGGMELRKHSTQPITNYVSVESTKKYQTLILDMDQGDTPEPVITIGLAADF
jgi:predicted enzyme related to lactoylglutathione lyase